MDLQKPYRIQALELGPMENFIYLITDIATNRTAVVDPAWDVPEILKIAQEQQLQITDILLTHSHQDHINGVEGILDAYDAKLHLLHAEAQFWGKALTKPCLHHGGDRIDLGKTQIDVLHTPGHTPGSTCYLVDDQVITGDTLFVFGCGRCDLQGGDPETMYVTLQRLASDLPKHTCIHPGHNYAVKTTSTMEEQVQGNPFLHFDRQADFVNYRMHIHDKVRESPYGPESKKPSENAKK